MEKKNFALFFVVGFIALTFYLWQNNDQVADLIANDGWTGFTYYFLTNTSYVVLLLSIVLFNDQVMIGRNLLGGLALIYAMDITSYPRILTSGIQAGGTAVLASSDGLVFKELSKLGYSFSTIHTFYYLVLPIALVLISLNLLGFANFHKKLIGKG